MKIIIKSIPFIIVAIGISFLINHISYFKSSSELQFDKEYNFLVMDVRTNRGSIVLNDSILIYMAVNYSIIPNQLISYIQKSDSLFKPSNSDSIFLFKKDICLAVKLIKTE